MRSNVQILIGIGLGIFLIRTPTVTSRRVFVLAHTINQEKSKLPQRVPMYVHTYICTRLLHSICSEQRERKTAIREAKTFCQQHTS
jgi:uncharacterized membrane protein YadS